MVNYTKGEILFCPLCGKLPAGEPMPVDDFVVPGSEVGTVEDNECWECYGEFSVEVGKDGNFGAYDNEIA